MNRDPQPDTAAAPQRLGRIAVGATEFAWFERGAADKPAIVLCHGMGLDHHDFDTLAQALSTDWRVLQWEMPGHGLSGPLPDPCTLAAFADALEALIASRGVVRPVVLGFSFGGMVAQEALRRRRTPFRALIAYGCFAPFAASAPLPPAVIDAVVAAQLANPDWTQVRDKFAAACAVTPEGQAALRPAIDRAGPATLAAMTRALFASFEPDPGFVIDIPLLVLRGALDSNSALLALSEQALLSVAPAGRQMIIDHAGHCAHLDAPAALNRAILSFLGGLPPTGDPPLALQ